MDHFAELVVYIIKFRKFPDSVGYFDRPGFHASCWVLALRHGEWEPSLAPLPSGSIHIAALYYHLLLL